MAMPTDIPASQAPSYIIYRDAPPGELYDPTAPLAFFPPKDSDELFDALRAKYPHLKSHSERMRDATIEFLLEERQAEALSATVSPAMPSLYDSMADTSPWQQSWPSASMTTLSSPDMTNFATPAFGDSPKSNIPQLARQQSSAATPSESQTPAIDQMTSVFSLSTSEQPKQRVRRKMTEAEKVEYRKRRIVKACDKCSKRKRKCIHNQPEMEGLKKASDKAQSKVTKPRTNTSKTPDISFPSFDTADGLLGGYEDFTLMFDPAPEFNFDDTPAFDMPVDNFWQFEQTFEADNAKPTWHQNHMQDWTTLGSNVADSFSSFTQSTEAVDDITGLMFPHPSQTNAGSQSRHRCDLRESTSRSLQTSNSATDQLDVRFQRTPSSSVGGGSQDGVSLPQTPTHTAHVHDMQALQYSMHVDERVGAADTAEDSRSNSDGGATMRAISSRGQSLSDTALRRSLRSETVANRSAVNDGPQSTNTRHRLRGAGLIDPALQSELSSTSAISSSSVSTTENATALEGRPAASGVPSSSQSSLRATTNSRRVANATATMSAALLMCSSPTQEETAPRPPVAPPVALPATVATSTALQRQPTRASSALLAQSSPFDNNASAPARSTELFRLRHRISTSIGAAPLSSSSSLSSQANGGSRLSSTARGVTAPADRLLVRTLARTEAANAGAAAPALQLQAPANRSLATTLARTEGTDATDFNGARKIFTETETARYRDHHGRPSALFAESDISSNKLVQTLWTLVAVVALGAMLLLASAFLYPSIPALAALATVSAISHRDRTWLSSMRSKAHSAFNQKQRKSRASLTGHTLIRSVCC
ncbi:hypothetical protein Q7P37_002207 [Cladosporium fusiforme]